ncbi:hypothetical protein G7Z17_g4700 [Cylindrodendrum hubeiense]|uniref:Uncharacterized protein n=1 Tax=Cylindrodendrum hubeiense TaxID=595255 RepID=A0A9P5LI18_9HYPO|nr:hypothetical protein G7Z17_g4700 [Cylindrodendrum hubeiense]
MAKNISKKVLDRCPLPRHEILHYLRSELETTHRSEQWGASLRIVLNATLHNWLYRKWFQPYKSDIEYGQFIAKMMSPRHIPEDIGFSELFDLLVSMNAAICAQVEEAQQQERERQERHIHERRKDARILNEDYFIVQPLFRAMAIVFLAGNFTMEVTNMGQLPVLIMITGVEDGLSAPISFESIAQKAEAYISKNIIQVSLETAIAFVMDLEQREAAAFGRHPDPIESTKYLTDGVGCRDYILEREGLPLLGWGNEPLEGPSSTWVDLEKYPEWTGGGAFNDDAFSRPARMLAAYPQMFGRKVITRATILHLGEPPHIRWQLEELLVEPSPSPPPLSLDSSPMSRKAQRRHRRVESRESNKSTKSNATV